MRQKISDRGFDSFLARDDFYANQLPRAMWGIGNLIFANGKIRPIVEYIRIMPAAPESQIQLQILKPRAIRMSCGDSPTSYLRIYFKLEG